MKFGLVLLGFTVTFAVGIYGFKQLDKKLMDMEERLCDLELPQLVVFK